MKYCYIPIGYPVGYFEKDDYNVYKIETRSEMVEVNEEAFNAWFGIDGYEFDGEVDGETLRFLKSKNLVFEEDTILSMFSRLFNAVPFRQGWGDIREDKYAVIIGGDIYYPDKLQMDIWRNADGRNTILDILRMLAKEHNITGTEDKIDFMMKLDSMLSCRLIYIK